MSSTLTIICGGLVFFVHIALMRVMMLKIYVIVKYLSTLEETPAHLFVFFLQNTLTTVSNGLLLFCRSPYISFQQFPCVRPVSLKLGSDIVCPKLPPCDHHHPHHQPHHHVHPHHPHQVHPHLCIKGEVRSRRRLSKIRPALQSCFEPI